MITITVTLSLVLNYSKTLLFLKLQGALVSVSGGAFRRNAATAQDGRLRFSALSPAQYYVKPNMKEFRFNPPHAIVTVDEGREYSEVFR